MKETPEKKPLETRPTPFKLGFREIGEWVQCYMMTTIPEAERDPEADHEPMLLASIRLSILRRPGAFDEYQEIMTKSMAYAVEQATGLKPTHWTVERGPQPAPSDVKGDPVK